MTSGSPRKVLVTCPPMLGQLHQLKSTFAELNWEVTAPQVTQTLSESQLVELVPAHHGWIIGDDPANANVVSAGAKGLLKAAVKWGAGVDNIDFDAFSDAEIPITNTPGMFGNEVADVALGYLIGLSRQTFLIDRAVKRGEWPKPSGTSLAGTICALVGYGDIGAQLATRLRACGVNIRVYDPAHSTLANSYIWPEGLADCDFICFTCALNQHTYHMLNKQILDEHCKPGVRIVNVARGHLIDERALEQAIETGLVDSVALDVFETEPLPKQSALRANSRNIFGSHNSSNTTEAVMATSFRAINLLEDSFK